MTLFDIKPQPTDLFSHRGAQPATLPPYLLLYSIGQLAELGYTGPINTPPPYNPETEMPIWHPEENYWSIIPIITPPTGD